MDLTDRQQATVIASSIIVLLGLGSVIPLIGTVLGPLFKGFAGLVGGAVAAYLVSSGGRSGARIGAIVGLAGGIASGVVNFVLNLVVSTAAGAAVESGAAGGAMSAVFFGGIGLLTSWVFVVIGAVLGAGAVGWMFGDQRTTEKTEMSS